MAAELGQQTVEFTALVQRAAEDSYLALKELVERSKASSEPRSDAEKKIDLLKFVAKTRQRMLRLHVLAKWCQQVPLIHYCQQLASTLSSHDSCFTQTADSLFFMHEGLQQARAPSFDVPSAIEVLLTGSYQRLPKCIEDLSIQSALSEDEQKLALKKLDTLVRSKLLEVSLPKEISDVTISDGTAVLRVDGEFKVFLTLGYHGHLSLWRILHLELLVGEKNGPIKLEESRRYALGDDLERRMAAADNPFLVLYTVLHELCVALVMDTVVRQVQVLRQGRWKDAIRFELISDGTAGLGGSSSALQLTQDVEIDSSGLKTPGLKIIYWLDLEKNSAASDFSACPYIRIEPGHDTQIKCLHSSFVLDPFTEKEASFSLDQSCIDVEKLLLRVISCNRHTRLLEIQRELTRNGQIYRGSSDIILCHEKVETKNGGGLDNADYFGDEVLRVRAFGTSYIILGMNIRNGKFLLQSSKNVLSTSTLVDCEEALNLGHLSATDVFTNLRNKSILNVFASTGRFLGLQVHDHLSNLKIPETISHGTDMILMGFPQCADTYFLLLQVDKDFKPVFTLLESQLGPNGKPHSLSDVSQLIRFNKIDIGQMQMINDELNISLFDWEKLHSLSNMGTFNQISELGFNPDVGQEASLQLPCSQSNFSSIVDEVFGSEKGASSGFSTGTQHSSSYKMPPLTHVNSLHTSQPGMKSGISSPKSEGRLQQYQASNTARLSSEFMGSSNAAYLPNGRKGFTQNVATSSLSSSPIRSSSNKFSSRSEQDLSNIKSPYSAEVGQFPNMEDDHLKFANEPSKELRTLDGGQQFSLQNLDSNRFKSLSTGNLDGLIEGQTPDIRCFSNLDYDGSHKHEKQARKRSLLDILTVIPSLQMSKVIFPPFKRRKLLESPDSCFAGLALTSSTSSSRTSRYTFGHLFSETNHAITPLNVFVSVLLHVVKHCSLCIKHAQLTSQMDALDIPYVEGIGLRTPSSNLWLKLPFATDSTWHRICLRLGKPGTMCWDVKIEDLHFRELWELQNLSTSTTWGSGVRLANASEVDSHIHCDPEGIVLCYKSVESDSIQKLVSDLQRLYNARLFACGMRKLVGLKSDDKIDENNTISESKISSTKVSNEGVDKLSEQIRRSFKIEAVGLVTLWFSYGSMPVVHFVVEWEAGKDGCTMHISPDQLWPHTKFLEDFVNGGEVASFLDCIRLTAGPLLALCGAIRPARIPVPVSAGYYPVPKQNTHIQSHGNLANTPSNVLQPSSNVSAAAAVIAQLSGQNLHTAAAVLSAAGRSGPGLVPSSLLPFDVSVVLRGPYWIRIIYRKKFAVDMRCFAGDQVWLQPATPPKGGPAAGGSLPCPQFRPFIMEHVAQGLNALEPNFTGASHTGVQLGSSNTYSSLGTQSLPTPVNRPNAASSGAVPRPNIGIGTQIGGGINRIGSTMLASTALSQGISGVPLRISPGTGFAVHVKGELNTAFIGLGDDGGYGGGWVPLAALKKVLRGILKYLGVLWLFAQLPDLLKEILGSILKENEGTLLNLDQEQPALRFFVGGYVFAVSVHRVQLLLQVLSVKRFHHQQQQQQNQSNTQEELTPAEINEICDYFSRRVASEPYDASRVASFITLLTLPVSVLREFLKLISWKKGLSHSPGGDIATTQKARIELCLENHLGTISDENSETTSSSKSNIHHDREHSSVDFALTFVLDSAFIPHMNAAGGAAWLPYCVSVRLKYFFGENAHVSFLGMEGSHGGKACWSRHEDWERCKQRMARTAEISNGTTVDTSQGRLKLIAETLQRALQASLQQLKDGASSSISSGI